MISAPNMNASPGLVRSWFPVAWSEEVADAPVARSLLGTPIVLFRAARGVVCLDDACPHKRVPLSLGQVRESCIVCPYHGWRFDDSGHCVGVPALAADQKLPVANVRRYKTVERQGTIWCTLSDEPLVEEPPGWLGYDEAGFFADTLVHCGYLRVIENMMDAAHAAFIHGGLLRGQPTTDTAAQVLETETGVVKLILGEKRRKSLLYRAFVGSEDEFMHREEFALPSTVCTSYMDQNEGVHVGTQFISTPLDPGRTRIFYRLRLSQLGRKHPLVTKLVLPVMRLMLHKIMTQDVWILEHEERSALRFAERKPAPIQLDTPALWAKAAARHFAINGVLAQPRQRKVDLAIRL